MSLFSDSTVHPSIVSLNGVKEDHMSSLFELGHVFAETRSNQSRHCYAVVVASSIVQSVVLCLCILYCQLIHVYFIIQTNYYIILTNKLLGGDIGLLYSHWWALGNAPCSPSHSDSFALYPQRLVPVNYEHGGGDIWAKLIMVSLIIANPWRKAPEIVENDRLYEKHEYALTCIKHIRKTKHTRRSTCCTIITITHMNTSFPSFVVPNFSLIISCAEVMVSKSMWCVLVREDNPSALCYDCR